MNVGHDLTWAELDPSVAWTDVDYSDVPKHQTKWHSDLEHLAADLIPDIELPAEPES